MKSEQIEQCARMSEIAEATLKKLVLPLMNCLKFFLKIQNEIIFYNKKTKNTFENLKRSLFNSPKKLKYENNISKDACK